MAEGSIWERFSLDPRHVENSRLRASDRDRDVVNDLLGTAYAEGRLTPEELDERSDRVAQSRTLGDLPPIIDDLVASTPAVRPAASIRAEAEDRYRQHRQQALMGFLIPTVICWVIWAATSQGFPWPVFVMIGTGARLAQLLGNREGAIREITKGLEKKERKKLAAREQKRPQGARVNQG